MVSRTLDKEKGERILFGLLKYVSIYFIFNELNSNLRSWLHIAIYLELFATVYSCTSALVDFHRFLKKNMCCGHSKYCISSKLGA